MQEKPSAKVVCHSIASNREIWEPVEGYIGVYEVSNHGRVKSLSRKVEVTNNNGTFMKSYPSKILKSYITAKGYELVKLCREGVVKSFSVHRLVASSFVLDLNNLPEVNHIDGDKLNNYVSNLEWVTASDNQKHAFSMGLQKAQKGESNGGSRLNETDVLFIHYWRSLGYYAKQISECFGCSKSHIQDILGFRRWRYIKELL